MHADESNNVICYNPPPPPIYFLQWYDHIRNDHSQMVQEKPPVGLQGTVQLRFRLPDGERVSRRFLQTDDVQVHSYNYFVHVTDVSKSTMAVVS